jgi:nucleotide-binding universal stress UspA family protein
MAYKTILLSLNDVPRAEAMIDAAAAIATAHGAHVIGCYVIPAVTIYPEVGYAAPPAVYEAHQQYFKTNMAAVKQRFETRMKQDGLLYEWREMNSVYSDIAPSLIEIGASADLILMSQIAENSEAEIETGLVERVVVESGRPVLIIPQAGSYKAPKSVVVGYNGTREAARAAFDAVPLLRGAKDVRVVWVDPYKQRQSAGELPGAEMATVLARQGVKVVAEGLETNGLNAGDALLRLANDRDAELLVMGAYAHSRLRQYIFGGATQHVMEHARIPVLMSH